MADIIYIIILITGSLALLWGIAQILVLERNINNFIVSGLYISVGIIQIHNYLQVTGHLLNYPHVSLINYPFVALIGPLLYILFKFLMKENYKFRSRDIIHLVPCLIVIILLVPFYIQDAETKRQVMKIPPLLNYAKDYFSSRSVVLFIALCTAFTYMIIFIKTSKNINKKKYIRSRKSESLVLSIITAACMIILIFSTGVLLLSIFFTNNDNYTIFLAVQGLFISFCIFLYIFWMVRYPDFFRQYQVQYREIRSNQKEIDIDLVNTLSKLQNLMEEEKLYCDEDLTLTRLAKVLSISQHRLSQLINDTYNKNFNSYINEYRINYAKDLLINQPERPIIEIAHTVGFNTLSVFYKWFYKITEQTPKDVRRNVKSKMQNIK